MGLIVRADDPGPTPPVPRRAFDATIFLLIEGQWVFVSNAKQALDCLQQRFPDTSGPSFIRAVTTCEACLAEMATPQSAQVTLVVAAMEAGFPFEVIEDASEALERRTDLEAEAGLRTILWPT